MKNSDLEQIKNMPKVVLHIHLDGSLRPETVYKWLKEKGEDVTLKDVQKRLMVEKDCRDLTEYLEKFDLPCQELQTKEHIEQATYELFEDLAKQNVIYAEVRFAPSKHTEQGLTYSEVVKSAIDGMNKAKKDFNIKGNLILCCMRGDSKENNEKTVETAKEFLNKGVCSLDLAGAEALFPTEDYIEIFEEAAKNGVPFTIHAGEAAGPESIRYALDYGKAKRIGHGVHCLSDKSLIERLIKEEIILEVCPTSNLQTKAIEDVSVIEKLHKKGLLVCINQDNTSVSNTDIIEEYKMLLGNTNLTIKDLAQTNINAICGAFLTPQEKASLKAQIKNAINEKDEVSFIHT